MSDVFISYSRKDTAFVRQLHEALTAQGRDVWVDWEDIPFAEDWWQKICNGIEEADNFVFIITPASAASQVCFKEIEYAARNHKRIVPVLRCEVTEPSDIQQMHPLIVRANWLPFHSTDDSDIALAALLRTLDTDPAYVKMHTRLLIRAREWVGSHRAASLLLYGADLHEAEMWLSKGINKEPTPTEVQKEYLVASRKLETRRTIGRSVIFLVFILLIGILLRPLIVGVLTPIPDPNWVFVEPGLFMMGNEEGTRNEKPQHQVEVLGFEITKYEITNSEYAQCVQALQCESPDSVNYENLAYQQHPVVGVNWFEAQTFCKWVGGRLPTEAEWEKAATWIINTSSKRLLVRPANTFEEGPGDTTPIGSFPDSLSPFGLLDTSGNVWEWTSSLMRPYPYGTAHEDASPGARVARGGSFMNLAQVSIGTNRVGFDPGTRERDLGFRCVRSK